MLEGELKEIFADVVKAPERQLWLSSPERPVSDLPPVPLPEGAADSGEHSAPGEQSAPGDQPEEPRGEGR